MEFSIRYRKVYEILIKYQKIPSKLLIISDKKLEDSILNINSIEKINKKYVEKGLALPNIVFWNLNNSGKEYPFVICKNNIEIITGFSEYVIKFLLEGKRFLSYSPIEDSINKERYAKILHLLT